MKKLLLALTLLISLSANAEQIPNIPPFKVGPKAMPAAIAPVKPPFVMAQPQKPLIPQRTVMARLKGHSLQTKRIQKAIDQTAAQGGGTVVLPSGKWNTGRITLKSNVNLHLSEGCELHFSGRINDYLPVVFTRDEGIELHSLGAFIYAHNAHDIALTGQGQIVGPPTNCEIYRQNAAEALNIEQVTDGTTPDQRVYDGKNTKAVFLPKTIAPINCKNVLIEGVTLRQGLYWNVVPQYCDNVIVRGVTVRSYGHGRTDGIDIESSTNVLVEYCSLDCQDDCYTLKSGRGDDGLRVARATQNVVIRNCEALRGAGGIVCGSETAGGVNNVYVENCHFDGTTRAFSFKSRRNRGGGVNGIYINRVTAQVTHYCLCIDELGSAKWSGELANRLPARPLTRLTPKLQNIFIHDVDITAGKALFNLKGLPEQPAKEVFFGNARIKCPEIGSLTDVASFTLKDVTMDSPDTKLTIDGCDNAQFFGFNNFLTGKPIEIVKSGQDSHTLTVQTFPLRPVNYNSVKSGEVWLDNHARPIQAHAFQLFYDERDSTYYWYGENKQDALVGTNRMFGGVRLYSSRDFYNWRDEGLLLAPDTLNPMSPVHYSQKVERPHIVYCKKTGKYVMWAKAQATDGYFVVFQADHFRGPYTFVRNLLPAGFCVGDFDMWVDPATDKAYVWFERPHWEMICSDLTDDYTDVTDHYSRHFSGIRPPLTREAPAHFVHNGKHYLFTSGTTGYTANPTEVAVFTDPHGEYTVLGDPCVDDSTRSSFYSQITSIVRIPGKKDLYVALADRWLPQDVGTDVPIRTMKAKAKSYLNHQPVPQRKGAQPTVRNREYTLIGASHDVYNATYVFLPISFENGMPRIHWKAEWKLDDYK